MVLSESVCGSSCTDFNESFDRVLNELDFLKDKVENLEEKVDNLEAQNLVLENKIQLLEVSYTLKVVAVPNLNLEGTKFDFSDGSNMRRVP